MENALLGENGADQKRNQQNDRHRVPADALEVIDHRRKAEFRRVGDDAQEGDHQSAGHLREQHNVGEDRAHGAADAFQCRGDGVGTARQRRQFSRAGAHLLEQVAVTVRQADDPGVAAPAGPDAQGSLDQPGAIGIEALDTGDVDDNALHCRIGPGRMFDQRLKRARVLGRPCTGRGQAEAARSHLAAEQGTRRHHIAPYRFRMRNARTFMQGQGVESANAIAGSRLPGRLRVTLTDC